MGTDDTARVRATLAARVGERIRRARLHRNLTQGELAKGMFSVSYVSAVERGQIHPSLGAIERLAERLQVPISDLLSEASGEEPEVPLTGVTPGEDRTAEVEQARKHVALRLREAQILAHQGKTAVVIPLLQEVLGLATSTRERAVAHVTLASCYMAQGQPEQARTALLEALSLAERLGDRELLERSRHALGDAYQQLNQHLLALVCYRACYEAIQQGIMRDLRFKLTVLSSLGQEYQLLGEDDQAIALLIQATGLPPDIALPEQLGAIYWMLSAAYRAQGDTGQAKRSALQSIQSYEEAGNRREAARVHGRLGRAYLAARQMEEAEAHLRLAQDMARRLEDAHGLAETGCGLSELYRRRNQYDEAEREARAALAAAEGQSDVAPRAEALIAVAEVLEARGKRRDANVQLKQATKLLQDPPVSSSSELAAAFAHLSSVYEGRNDTLHALESLKRAWKIGGRPRLI